MLRPITLCITILLATACMDENTDRNGPQAAMQPGSPVQAADRRPTAADNLTVDLGLSLLRYVAKEEGGDQVLISPHGIASALVLAWNGAAGKCCCATAQFPGPTSGWRRSLG